MNKVQIEARKILAERMGMSVANSGFLTYYTSLTPYIWGYLKALESANQSLVSKIDAQAAVLKQLEKMNLMLPRQYRLQDEHIIILATR